jgi:hypothetical protein
MENVDPLRQPASVASSSEREERRSRRRRRSESRERLEHQLRLVSRQRRSLAIATAALAVLGVMLAIGMLWAQSALQASRLAYETDTDRFKRRISDTDSKLALAQRGLKDAQARIETLVDQRIPGLVAVELRRTIPIQHRFVREISFQRLATNGREGLEYKLVIENTSPSPIELLLTLQLFDDVGVEMGRSNPTGASSDEVSSLRAGEIRSYFAVFESKIQPTYFRLVTGDH